jgi:hypothetical protein
LDQLFHIGVSAQTADYLKVPSRLLLGISVVRQGMFMRLRSFGAASFGFECLQKKKEKGRKPDLLLFIPVSIIGDWWELNGQVYLS